MKKLFSNIAVFLSLSLFICLFYSPFFCISSRAVSSDQLVVKHAASWGSYDFDYVFHGSYYSVADPTGIPTSTLANPQYFYTNDGVTFGSVSGTELILLVLNRGVGLILDPDNVTNYIRAFFDAIGPNHLDTVQDKFVQGGLYDNNDNFLGYCLDDISGCYWGGLPVGNVDFTVPTQTVQNVRNYVDSVSTSPDFFTYYGMSEDFIARHFYNSAFSGSPKSYFDSHIGDFSLCTPVTSRNGYLAFFAQQYNSANKYLQFSAFVNPVQYLAVSTNNTSRQAYDNFCNNFKITNDSPDLLGSEIMDFSFTSQCEIYVKAYSVNDTAIEEVVSVDCSAEVMNVTSISIFPIGTQLSWIPPSGTGAQGFGVCFPFNVDKITVYYNINTKYLMDDHLYYPDSYTTDAYNNYDSNNDNSFTTNITQLSNVGNTNSSIYNDSNDEYYEYYDNGTYDYSSNVTNVTNITNNYYNGGSDNPDNPDDPDDPSGTLDEILRAILRFFNAIGDIIGTLLASILNLIDSVLEALAGVMENLTGMSDFFAALFSWIPEPVPQILGAGFGICLVCGIIKFIRG